MNTKIKNKGKIMIDTKKIERAKALATEAHQGQFRKYNKLPYVVHPEQVHDEVLNWLNKQPEGSEFKNLETTMRCAAYLHDVLEDCPQISEARIVEETDGTVLALVKELTNPSKGMKAPRFVRKKMDREHIQNVSLPAKVIKLVDRTVNLGDMGTCPDTDFTAKYADESFELYKCLRTANNAVFELEENLLSSIEKLQNV